MTVRTQLVRATEYARGAIRGHWRVRIGAGVRLTGRGEYRLQRGSCVRGGARIWVGDGAVLTLKRGSAIGARNVINVESGLTLGEETQVSWDTQILDTDFHQLTGADGTTRKHTAVIEIGRHVLIGTGVMVLKGVTIGDGAVVAAGSVVTRSVASGAIVAGNPARVVGEVTSWE